MTYREFMQQNYPEKCDPRYVGGCAGCPGDVVDGAPADNKGGCPHDSNGNFLGCDKCWDLPMPQNAKKDPTE